MISAVTAVTELNRLFKTRKIMQLSSAPAISSIAKEVVFDMRHLLNFCSYVYESIEETTADEWSKLAVKYKRYLKNIFHFYEYTVNDESKLESVISKNISNYSFNHKILFLSKILYVLLCHICDICDSSHITWIIEKFNSVTDLNNKIYSLLRKNAGEYVVTSKTYAAYGLGCGGGPSIGTKTFNIKFIQSLYMYCQQHNKFKADFINVLWIGIGTGKELLEVLEELKNNENKYSLLPKILFYCCDTFEFDTAPFKNYENVELKYGCAMEDFLFPLNPHVVYTTAVAGPLFYYDLAIKAIEASMLMLGNIPVLISFKSNLKYLTEFTIISKNSDTKYDSIMADLCLEISREKKAFQAITLDCLDLEALKFARYTKILREAKTLFDALFHRNYGFDIVNRFKVPKEMKKIMADQTSEERLITILKLINDRFPNLNMIEFVCSLQLNNDEEKQRKKRKN
jgi:hypothetical protein